MPHRTLRHSAKMLGSNSLPKKMPANPVASPSPETSWHPCPCSHDALVDTIVLYRQIYLHAPCRVVRAFGLVRRGLLHSSAAMHRLVRAGAFCRRPHSRCSGGSHHAPARGSRRHLEVRSYTSRLPKNLQSHGHAKVSPRGLINSIRTTNSSLPLPSQSHAFPRSLLRLSIGLGDNAAHTFCSVRYCPPLVNKVCVGTRCLDENVGSTSASLWTLSQKGNSRNSSAVHGEARVIPLD